MRKSDDSGLLLRANGSMELPSADRWAVRGDVRASEGKAFSCGHTELEMSVRHPNGNTKGGAGYMILK